MGIGDLDHDGGASTFHGGGGDDEGGAASFSRIGADILESFPDDLDRVLETWMDRRRLKPIVHGRKTTMKRLWLHVLIGHMGHAGFACSDTQEPSCGLKNTNPEVQIEHNDDPPANGLQGLVAKRALRLSLLQHVKLFADAGGRPSAACIVAGPSPLLHDRDKPPRHVPARSVLVPARSPRVAPPWRYLDADHDTLPRRCGRVH